jgi:DnaK suppressor protein
MPRALTNMELENFKDKLLRQKKEAWGEIMEDMKHHASEEYHDFVQMVYDQADYALAQLKENTVFSFIEHKYRELEEIEQALTRIESGAYGHCIDCGGWIGGARLSVMPAAIRCRKCQEALEKFDRIQ